MKTIEKIKQMIAEGVLKKEDAEKYIPELKESEDERIRKALIGGLKDCIYSEWHDGVSIKECIVWLEKQGEHKKFRDSIQVGDKVTRNEDGELVNLSQLNRVAKKQGEQKPADKVEPKFKVGDIVKHKDNPYLTYILKRFTDDGDYEFHAIGKDGHEGCTCFSVVKYQDEWELVEQKSANWLQELEDKLANATPQQLAEWKEKYFKEEPAEWSEEDELRMNTVCELLDRLDLQQNWLKSLKDRVVLQPKQGWSEEDEYCRHQLIVFCENCMLPDTDAIRCANWLKSLRPQNHWEPSDE